MSQKTPLNLNLMKISENNIMKKVMKDIFLKWIYLEKLYDLHDDLPFLPERIAKKKVRRACG